MKPAEQVRAQYLISSELVPSRDYAFYPRGLIQSERQLQRPETPFSTPDLGENRKAIMDYDNWMEANFVVDPENKVDRTAHDMRQANLMRRSMSEPSVTGKPRKSKELPASPVSEGDYDLALRGLEKAAVRRNKNDLVGCLKMYEMSVELLLKLLKSTDLELDRSLLADTTRSAIADAEAVKAQLDAKKKSHASLAQRQKSFDSVQDAMTTAIRKPTANRKRPVVTTRRSPTQRRGPAAVLARDELRDNVVSDFYVPEHMLQSTTWDDIAGLAPVKQSLQEVAILPLIRPDLFTGLRRPQNILLYGPPGTGKTLLARAVANESKSNLFICSASTMTSKWLGDAEKLVRKLFEVARESAPSILFIDEMDALLSSRKSDGGEHEASRRLKTEFMVQMDGMTSGPGNVLLIACTNCPWDVDSAVMRRFPRRIFVPLPDKEARQALVDILLDKAGKHSLTARQKTTLVNRTNGFSCSDIAAIASEASFGPLRSIGGLSEIKKIAADDVRPVQLQDFETVIHNSTRSVTEAQLKRYREWLSEQGA